MEAPKSAAPDPSGEENTPPTDPGRRSAENKMRESSNVRPSNDPTPSKAPPSQGSADPASSLEDA